MAKHRIDATSSMCRDTGHNWQTSLAPNYRVCRSCRSVEMCVDGQWFSPTGRVKRSPDEVATSPAPNMLQQVGVRDRDLQAPTTTLDVLPIVSTVSPTSPAAPLMNSRKQLGDQLFQWGTEHNYPQLRVQMPGRVYTIVPGSMIWRMVCYQSPVSIIEAAVQQIVSYQPVTISNENERVQREKLLECGRLRDWQQFAFKTTKPDQLGSYQFTLIISEGEGEWQRFAVNGDYDQVCAACELLAHVDKQQGENA